MNVKSIGEEAGMIDDRRVIKLFGAVNKKIIGRGNRSKIIWITEVQQSSFQTSVATSKYFLTSW